MTYLRQGRHKNPDVEQRRHWAALRELGSIWSQIKPVEIAHCHGGSIIDTFTYDNNPGWAQKQNHWLVIPLTNAEHQGKRGLDADVRAWEAIHVPQIILLEWVSHLTGINVFHKARLKHDFHTTHPWQNPVIAKSHHGDAPVKAEQIQS